MNKIIKKPWGQEYLAFESQDVGLWHLTIKNGQSTSTHCHPNKKTGLVILGGEAVVKFLHGEQVLRAGEKIMIRPGAFHSTKAISGDVDLLEIETPPIKDDIVRLYDNYGREGQKIEQPNCEEEGEINIDLGDWFGSTTWNFDETIVAGYSTVRNEDGSAFNKNESLLCLCGKIISFDGLTVYGPGDVINPDTFKLLLSKFKIEHWLELLCVSRRDY